MIPAFLYILYTTGIMQWHILTTSFLFSEISIANEDASPACNTNEKARSCLTQQVFNIYNSGCNEEKPEKPSVEIPKG